MSRLTHRTIEQGVAIGCPYCIDDTAASRTKTVALTGDDLSVASDLRVRISANWDNHSEPLQSMHLALLDKLLGGAK